MKSTDSVYALTGIKNYFLLPSRFDRMDINFKHHFSMIIDYFHMFLVRKTKVDRSSLITMHPKTGCYTINNYT